MNIRLISLLILLLLFLPGLVQADGTVQGYVSNLSTGVNIAGAEISYPGASTPFPQTNSEGFYSFSIPAGSYPFTASATGYASKTIDAEVIDSLTTSLDFSLSPMYIETSYPRLGLLDTGLEIEISGDGFDENTRLALLPDSGNRLDEVGKYPADDDPDAPYLHNIVSIAMDGSTAYVVDMWGHKKDEVETNEELGMLFVIDVDNPVNQANPTNPVLRGSLSLDKDDADNNEYGRDIAVNGSYAYVTYGDTDNNTGGLLVIDISNPDDPQLTGSVSSLNVTYGVAVQGDTVYVVDGICGGGSDVGNLHAINVDTPSSPYIEWSLDTAPDPKTPFSNCALGLEVEDGLAYVANEWQGLKIVDIDPDSPTFRQTLNPRTPPETPVEGLVEAFGVDVVGTTVFLAARRHGLLIYDVSNPQAPVKLGNDATNSTDTNGLANNVQVVGDVAYVADDLSGLSIFDVSFIFDDNPATTVPEYLGTIDTLGGAALDLVVSGSLAYVANASAGLGILNISNPEKPTLVGGLRTISGAEDVLLEVVGEVHTLYLTSYDGLSVIDVSDPSDPIAADPISTGEGQPMRMAKPEAGNTVYIASHYGDLKIVDLNLSDLSASTVTPVPFENGDYNYSWAVDVDSDYIYVADGDCDHGTRPTTGGLNLINIDVNPPAIPLEHERFELDGCATDVVVIGKRAYVSLYVDQSGDNDDDNNGTLDNGLKIVNVDPADPVYTFGEVIGSFSIDNNDGDDTTPKGTPKGLAVVGNYAYMASGWGGLLVFDVTDPETPLLQGMTGRLGHDAFDVKVIGDTAYVADHNNGIYVIDVSDRTNPVVVGSVDTPGLALNLVVDGDVAHVADELAGLTTVPLPFEFTADIIPPVQDGLIKATLPSPLIEGHYMIRAFHDTLDVNDTLVGAVTFSNTNDLLTSKAIIVAGGGPSSGPDIWEDTKAYANYAYDNLIFQGYRHEDITYITDEVDPLVGRYNQTILDAHARVQPAEKSSLYEAINTWAKGDANTSDLLIYLVDHGDTESFLMRDGVTPEHLTAGELDTWLDDFQTTRHGKVILVYDACRSGSFISRMIPPLTDNPPEIETRLVMTSSEPGQASYFLSPDHSFSSHFWSTFSGKSGNKAILSEAFERAFDTMASYQNAQLDANGNGVANEQEDYDALLGHEGTIYALRRQYNHKDRSKPVVGGVSAFHEFWGDTTASATLSARNIYDMDGDAIIRVWAEVIAPNDNPDPDGLTVTSLPTVELLDADENGVYGEESPYYDFDVNGTYIITYYAEDAQGIVSLPRTSLVTQNSGTSTETSDPDPYENDDIYTQASVIVINNRASQHHTFHQPGDGDWVLFEGISGKDYKIKASNPSLICDPVIEVYDTDGTTLLASSNNFGSGVAEFVNWTCPSDGKYYVHLTNNSGVYGANVRYSLRAYIPEVFSLPMGYVTGTVTSGGVGVNGAVLRASGGSGVSQGGGSYVLCLGAGSHSVSVSKSGYQPVAFSVSVGAGGSTQKNVVLASNNSPPTINGTPPTTVHTNVLYYFTPTVSDPDGDTLTFSATGVPSWASINTSGGTLSGVPNENQIGTYGPIKITVTDGQAEASLPEFSITVYQGDNLPPVISGSPPDITGADRMFSFTPICSDPNGDPLSFTINNKPSWAAFSTANGRLYGIPGDVNIGTHGPVSITVHDTSGANATLTFDIIVVPGSEIDKYGVLPSIYLLLKR